MNVNIEKAYANQELHEIENQYVQAELARQRWANSVKRLERKLKFAQLKMMADSI